ncbi:MAG: hypothetical protein B6A08_02200 [Sorangiineae bacterium NIC37A_2]|nr:MAG: hypothetical protein B6A08_02200 [Sorangiineae bacterium NIC37A_2]
MGSTGSRAESRSARARSRIGFRAAIVSASWLSLGACVPPGDGVVPPTDVLYFPVALTTDSQKAHLFVVGSDFDLQYNHGTIHSLSLARLRELAGKPCKADSECQALEAESKCDTEPTKQNEGRPSYLCVSTTGPHALDPCRGLGLKTVSLRASSPGLCAPVDLENPADGKGSLVRDVVQIPAFATDAVMLTRPSDVDEGPSERLFVPSRGDSALHWVDVEDGKLRCGQGRRNICSDDYRTYENPDVIADYETGETLKAPVDPFSITASKDGSVLAVTHQTDRAVSAYVHDWAEGARLAAVYRSTLGSPVSIDALPGAFASDDPESRTGFLMTFRDLAEVRLLRFFPSQDREGDPGALLEVGRAPLRLNSPGLHSRGIVVDSSAFEEKARSCAEGDVDCLLEARLLPRAVYVANRSPNSVVVGRMDPQALTDSSSELPTLVESFPVGEGPAQLFLGHVMAPSGKVEPRLFVVCFDAAVIYVFDPVRGKFDTQINTGRGPQGLAFDNFDEASGEVHPLLYVGHFTDSYVAVISLDQRYPTTYGATLATVGFPEPPRAAK